MRASRIFDNGRGDKYEVICDFYDSTHNGMWTVYVFKKPKGKRKFAAVSSSPHDRRFNGMSATETRMAIIRECLKEIPWTWIEMVMDDLTAEIKNLGMALYPKDE